MASSVAVERRTVVVGATTEPRETCAIVTFDGDGKATVTAAEVKLGKVKGIKGFCALGQTADAFTAVTVVCTTAAAGFTAGVTTLDLELVDDQSAAVADGVACVTFWGN